MSHGGVVLVTVVPTVLVLSWLGLWCARRRIPGWFFAAGYGGSLLLIAVAVAELVVARPRGGTQNQEIGNAAFQYLILSALAGLVTCVILGALTLLVAAVSAGARRLGSPAAERPPATGRLR